MSSKRQTNFNMSISRVQKSAPTVLAITVIAAVLTTTTPTIVECLNFAPPIMRLINDETLLLQGPKATTAAAAVTHALEPHLDEDYQPHYDMYRNSELRRLSYETIHRILRDENEPIHRRDDTETRYYQKRSYKPSHEMFRRAAEQSVEKLTFNQEPLQLLNLTHSNLTHLPATTGDYQQVRALDLRANAFRDLDLTIFPQLQWADLSHNAFAVLPLIENSTLSFINLNANRIMKGTAPQNCSNLHQLHLSANQIGNLATLNLSALLFLETLDLSCNRIEDLETAFFPQRMHNLKYLNLARNRLGSIYRENFYNLLSLNTLILTGNNITDIDYETFLALPNLQYLDLSHNQLRGESIRALQGIPDLVGLSIAYNPQLGEFMQEFVASWSLKELDASGTGLCQIPAALAQSVRTLKLSDNWLTIINSGDLDSYPLLQYLDISRSHVGDIEDDALGRLEILEVLLLNNNDLQKAPVSLPTSLRHLFLQHNQIMDIQVQTFQGLGNLQTLDLSHNKLLYLPALALPKLLTLNLQSSELCGVNQAIVHTLPRLREMLLEGNPIKCSDLLGIAEWVTSCRMADRAAPLDRSEDKSERPEENVSQLESTKNNLKQRFVQMHNFFENFRSNCKGNDELRRQQQRPVCAIESAVVDVKPTAAAAEVITSNFPTALQTTRNSSNTEAYDNQGKMATPAGDATQQLASRNNEVNAAATKTTTIIPTRNTFTTSSSNMATTSKTLVESVASTKPTATVAITTPTTSSSAVAKLNVNPTPPSTTDAEDANQAEPDTDRSYLINSKNAKTAKTTKTAAAAAINPKQQQLPEKATTMIASTPTLSKRKVLGRVHNDEAPPTETKRNIPTPPSSTETTSTTIYTRVPQTVPTTIKSASNYVETTTSLLSRQGLKASAAVMLVDVTRSDSNSSSNGSKFHKMEMQLKLNGTSGQPHNGAEPTTGSTILAQDLMRGSSSERAQQQHSSSNSSHSHAPMQLHIRNRHLIGTPLLMHIKHNSLVESEQLTLATESPSTTAPTTDMAAKAKLEDVVEKAAATRTGTTGGGSRPADKLDIRQTSDEVERRHFLTAINSRETEPDTLPASEAIKASTNEQNVFDVANLNSSNDKLAGARKIINTTLHYNYSKEALSSAHAAKPLKESVIKKKLALTLKKLVIPKKPGTSTQGRNHLQHQHQHQTLITPRENEADATHSVLSDRQLSSALKPKFNDDKTSGKLVLHKQRNTVNTPVDDEQPEHALHDLPQLRSIDQQHAVLEQQVGISKSEQWLDVRTVKKSSSHPGLVLLVSFIAFVALLLGLVQVYRCDKHWRRQRTGQRPHQRPLNEDSSGNSFLNYHNQHPQETAAPQKWLHSTGLLPPYRSPMHNLHVRELQKSSVVELQQNNAKRLYKFDKSASGSSSTSHSSHISSSQYSTTSAMTEDNAFYIEVTPNPSQPTSNPHSDLLPMELLSFPANRISATTSSNSATTHSLHSPKDASLTQIAATEDEHEATAGKVCCNDSSACSDKRLPLVRLTPTSRKFDLW